MSLPREPVGATPASCLHHEADAATERSDRTITEEPLELRVRGVPMATLMRTPGSDRELALGFYLTEGVIASLADVGPMTWIILASLVVGKTLGITFFGWLGARLGFPLPGRMGPRELVMAGFIAALGLTVALFVAGAAFTDAKLLGEGKMGALLSGFVGLAAIALGRLLGLGRTGSASE